MIIPKGNEPPYTEEFLRERIAELEEENKTYKEWYQGRGKGKLLDRLTELEQIIENMVSVEGELADANGKIERIKKLFNNISSLPSERIKDCNCAICVAVQINEIINDNE